MPDFHEDPEFRSLWRAARGSPDDRTPRLALADWLKGHGWAEEAAFHRSELSAALWRVEDAVRGLPLADLLEPGNLPAVAAVCLPVDALNKTAEKVHEAAAQYRGGRLRDGHRPPEPAGRPPKKPRRKT
jgi:uncharacterized protein (TIGR02996 family)